MSALPLASLLVVLGCASVAVLVTVLVLWLARRPPAPRRRTTWRSHDWEAPG